MKPFEVATLILGIVTTLLIPLIVFLIRGAMKWTRVEAKLDSVVNELRQIVADKNEVHNTIFQTMREDRSATDRRLRWLEEFLWRKGPSRSNDAA